MKNKKGSFGDLFFLLSSFFSVSFVLTFCIYIISIILATVESFGFVGSGFAIFATQITNIMSNLEWYFAFALFVYIGASLYYASKVSTGKVVYFAYIIIIYIISFVGNFITDAWNVFANNDFIKDTVSNMTVVPYIMNNITFIFLFYAIAMTIALIYVSGEEIERLEFTGGGNFE